MEASSCPFRRLASLPHSGALPHSSSYSSIDSSQSSYGVPHSLSSSSLSSYDGEPEDHAPGPSASAYTSQVHGPASSRAGWGALYKRRELRRMNKAWTLEEVRRHKYKDDAWIVVDGKVYDITEHILRHPGWESAAISTVLSIIAHSGTDCTEEFHSIHRPFPVAFKQLKMFYIGELASDT